MSDEETLQVFRQLRPGDRVEVVHEIRVGFRTWNAVTTGVVVKTERRRHSLHFRRSRDDGVFSDLVVLAHDDGERTTVTLDEFTRLKKLSC